MDKELIKEQIVQAIDFVEMALTTLNIMFEDSRDDASALSQKFYELKELVEKL
jgi:hypothetical protein